MEKDEDHATRLPVGLCLIHSLLCRFHVAKAWLEGIAKHVEPEHRESLLTSLYRALMSETEEEAENIRFSMLTEFIGSQAYKSLNDHWLCDYHFRESEYV